MSTDLLRKRNRSLLVGDPNSSLSLFTMVDTSPRHPLPQLPAVDLWMLHEALAPAGEGHALNMRTAAHPWAMDLLPLVVGPLVPDEIAQKLSEPRRKSSFDYANARGIYFTRKTSKTIINNNLYYNDQLALVIFLA